MTEYLIRTEAGDWPPVHRDRLAVVLMPPNLGCEAENGEGDFRMRCGDALLTFTAEEPGWHVAVESGGEVDALIEGITQRIAEEVRQPCYWVNLG